MTGLKVIIHALRMVWGNRREAVQIGLAPVMLMIVATVILRIHDGPIWSMAHALSFEQVVLNAFASEEAFLLMLLWVFATIWFFVSWHRFILLEEYPKGWLPPLHREESIAYLRAATWLFGIGIVALFVMVFVTAILGEVMFNIFVLGVALLAFVIYRISPILPAAAVGRKMGFSEVLVATQGASLTILMVMVFRYAASRVLDATVAGAADINGALGLIVFGVLTFVLSLINVSILTTIYGHWVEGRPLD
ncbi:hypothetical protein [Roseovarius pelagicus]|uniref:Uncharacterized protein n=1 Tax=Roseovarius pelagicus TaxID=2980108 RepID=A0ABY6D6Y2_9RHOB|nr:hypothetical protein [Roseovarius pelagicus]UXX81899.1 hypothetical protein N7U68_12275 [Roseovarius pelagicus]